MSFFLTCSITVIDKSARLCPGKLKSRPAARVLSLFTTYPLWSASQNFNTILVSPIQTWLQFSFLQTIAYERYTLPQENVDPNVIQHLTSLWLVS